MTFLPASFAQHSDDELLTAVKRLAAAERHATAALILALIELDARRLYLGEGYSSLFTYCTQALHLAEGAAYNRIEAARTARRFPAILTALEDGAVTLTTVRLVAPHLTTANHQDVLALARYKGKREVEELVASLRPLPPVASTIRKLPEPRQVRLDTNVAPTPTGAAPSPPVMLAAAIKTATPPTETPLAPERYRLQFTISRETHVKLRRVQALGRHVIPSGDPAEIFDRSGASSMCDGQSAARDPRSGQVQAHARVGEARRLAARRGALRLYRARRSLHGAQLPGVSPRAAVRGRWCGGNGEHRAAMPCAQRARGVTLLRV